MSSLDKIFKTIGASNHTDKERELNDYYATDPIAIDKLLKVEKPSHYIWECACGEGYLSDRLKQCGYEVISSDIVDRGYKDCVVEDFFQVNSLGYIWDILNIGIIKKPTRCFSLRSDYETNKN